MAFAMNLAAIPVKFVAIPVLAGLAAGTGALGAYVTGPATTANLVTSDTVLRGPAANEPAAKKPAKRSEQPRQRSRDVTVREVRSRDGFKRVYSVHSVPSASGQSTTPVIVVRPLPLNAYSSR